MADIRFYHLKTQTLDEALPALVMKAYDNGTKRVLIRVPDKAAAERINTLLWTFRPDVFLPHGTAKDGHAERQPVFIDAPPSGNPNGAGVLIACGGAPADNAADYSLVCEIFADHEQDIVAAARQRWRTYKEAGHALTYWQQSDGGRWEQKA